MSLKTEKEALGIDFGGTSVKLALVNDQGKITSRSKFSTRDASTQESWLEAVTTALHSSLGLVGPVSDHVQGIGIGVPGFVDFHRGYIHQLTNVKGWTDVHLAEIVKSRFKVPVFVDNHVNAMALGECTHGAGKKYQDAVFITLGTGVGGGLLLNNEIYRGSHSMAGEIGHMSIFKEGVKSPQGFGGLEQYVGNNKIIARAVEALEKGRCSHIGDVVQGDFKKITPKIISDAAHQGDELGFEIFDFVADCLSATLASITYLLQPQVFIIGGGVADSGRVLFEPLRKHLDRRLSSFFSSRVEMMPAQLGNDAGVIGSASLALSTLSEGSFGKKV